MGHRSAADRGASSPRRRGRPLARVFRRIEQAAAWSLLPLLLVQFLSGYAILHGRLFGGVLTKPTAFKLHRLVQPLLVIAFAVHALSRTRRALARRGIRHWAIDLLLGAVGAGLIAFAFYLYSRG
jgi:hypothetical protein